jgi:hypothetical protein
MESLTVAQLYKFMDCKKFCVQIGSALEKRVKSK